VEQQSKELPSCLSQQQQPGQQEQQHWFSGHVCDRERSSAVRTGEWEFIGRTQEESRPVPAMSVTASKNQAWSGSLVSLQAERLSDLTLKL
jgi:hypothetical protein